MAGRDDGTWRSPENILSGLIVLLLSSILGVNGYTVATKSKEGSVELCDQAIEQLQAEVVRNRNALEEFVRTGSPPTLQNRGEINRLIIENEDLKKRVRDLELDNARGHR